MVKTDRVVFEVFLLNGRPLRFRVERQEQENVERVLKSESPAWQKIDVYGNRSIHFKPAQVIAFNILEKKMETQQSGGISIRELARLLDVSYVTLQRRVNKPGKNSLTLEMESDRRIAFSKENIEKIAGAYRKTTQEIETLLSGTRHNHNPAT